MPEFLTDTGDFTDEFKTALPGMLGENHVDSKVMDDIPNISALVKSHADTKSALSKKLDNVIQKPGDSATDDEKAAYRTALAEASGAPKEASEYEFYKADKLPEGMERSTELEDKFRAVFHEHKAPKALVKALSQVFEEVQIAGFNGVMEADKVEKAKVADEKQKQFETESTVLKTDWPGDQLPTNARISLAAIQKYGSDELIKKLKDAGMYENAADIAKWRDSGVPIETLRLFHKIGKETLSAEALGKSGGGATGKKTSMYSRTKAQLGEN